MKRWLKRALAMLCGGVMVCSTLGGLVACKDKNNAVKTCNHEFDQGVVLVEKSCTRNGSLLKTCTLCGEEKFVVVAGGHSYSQTKTEVSCLRDGATAYKCTACGDSYRNITARASGHDTVGVTWTSTEEQLDGCDWAHVESAKCNDCEEVVTHTETYQKHEYSVTITKDATCSEAGELTYSCNDCDDEYTEAYTNAAAHAWVESATQSATENVVVYECDNDGCTETKTVFSAKQQTAATVPSAALQEAGEVELQNAAIKMDDAVLQQLNGKDVNISVETKDKSELNLDSEALDKIQGDVFDFSMSEGDNAVKNFDGSLTVSVPYTLSAGEDPNAIAIWYIKEDGTVDTHEATYANGFATFTTNHFSLYTVVRLTLEEYCGFYGHKNASTTFEASCNQQGYTLTVCSRCKNMTRDNFTAALQHNHEKTVIAPTCSEKGYTAYECGNCGDKYMSDYKETIAHKFTDAVTAPTCNKEGYTTHTCSVCGHADIDTFVAAKGHTYKNGSCSVCGKIDPNSSDAGNFYFNMIDSVLAAETFYLELKDVFVNVFHEGYGERVETKLDLARLVVGADETGLVGKGEGTMSMKYIETYVSGDVVTEEATANAIMVLKDGKIYIKATLTSESGTMEEMDTVIVYEQSAMLAEMGLGGKEQVNGGASNYDGEQSSMAMTAQQLIAMIEANEELLNKLVAEIVAVKNSPLNEVFETVTEFFFIKDTTADGYKFTLNKDCVKTAYNALSVNTLDKLFDTVFGKDAFTSTVNYLKDSLTKTVGVFETEATTELAKWGIQKDTLYALLNAFMGEEADVGAMITEMKDMTLLDVINSGAESEEEMMTAEDLKAQIDGIANMAKETTAIDLLIQMAMEQSEGEMNITKEEIDEMAGEKIDELLAMIGKSTITFETDKIGALVAFNMNFDGLTLAIGGEETSVEVKGAVSFIPDGNYAGEYNQIIKEAEKFAVAYDFADVVETEKYYLFKINGENFLWSKGYCNEDDDYGDWTSLNPSALSSNETVVESNVTVNGEVCTKYETTAMNLYRVFSEAVLAESDCEGWYELQDFDISGKSQTEVYVWKNANGEVVKMELKDNQNWNRYDGFGSAHLFYNPTTGKYASEMQHTYKLVDFKEEEGCKEGYYLYECTVCGHNYKDTFGEGHYVVYTAALKAGATSCEGGAIITATCRKCNEQLYTREVTAHETVDQQILMGESAECGKVYLRLYACACGEEGWLNGISSDCMFNSVTWKYCSDIHDGSCYDHRKVTYRCAVDKCGFEYTREDKANYFMEDGVCYRSNETTYVFPNNKTYNYKEQYESHWEVGETTYPDGVETTVWTCKLCKKAISCAKWDNYDRQIYHENYLDGYKWERVIDENCYGTTTYYENDRVTRTETGYHHATSWYGGSGQNCTQYYYEGSRCRACGYEDGQWWAPDTHWYDDHGHDWSFDGELYHCYRCNTESKTGANGMISLEDMRRYYDGETVKIGYFNYRDADMSQVEIKFNVNYVDDDNMGYELTGDFWTKEVTSPAGYSREAGIVSIDKQAMLEAIEAFMLQNEGVGFESVSIIFWAPQESSVGGATTMIGNAINLNEYFAEFFN